MGHSYRRTGVAGKPRYAAIFHDARGIRRSAGTYPTKKEADGPSPREVDTRFDGYAAGCSVAT